MPCECLSGFCRDRAGILMGMTAEQSAWIENLALQACGLRPRLRSSHTNTPARTASTQ